MLVSILQKATSTPGLVTKNFRIDLALICFAMCSETIVECLVLSCESWFFVPTLHYLCEVRGSTYFTKSGTIT